MYSAFFVSLLFVASVAVQNVYAINALPQPPSWVNEVPDTPQWWSTTDAVGESNVPKKEQWAKVKVFEQQIAGAIKNGKSSLQQRRNLIKYLTRFLDSPEISAIERCGIKIEIASVYARMGEHKFAVKRYLEILRQNPRYPDCLHSLASEYERLSEVKSAIEIYEFMTEEFKNDKSFSAYSTIGKTCVACLKGKHIGCTMRKPLWWDGFEKKPNWWAEISIEFPTFTSVRDGFDFAVANPSGKRDNREIIKYKTALLEMPSVTFSEKTMIYLSLARSYSLLGDHYRAIENAWEIPEKFSSDLEDSRIALVFIAGEFKKLGEFNHAREIEDVAACFLKNANKDSGQ